MAGPILQQKVKIVNPQGLHMRPASEFAAVARKFQSEVFVSKDKQRVSGKNALELLLLVALEGSEVIVEVSGPDAADAMPALLEVFNTPSDDPAQ